MNPEKIALWGTIVWPIITGLFNILFRWKTDEQWVEFCERRPWGAMVVKFVRTAGLDPVGVVRAIRQFAETKQRQRDTLKPSEPVRPIAVSKHAETWAADIDRQLAEDIDDESKTKPGEEKK